MTADIITDLDEMDNIARVISAELALRGKWTTTDFARHGVDLAGPEIDHSIKEIYDKHKCVVYIWKRCANRHKTRQFYRWA